MESLKDIAGLSVKQLKAFVRKAKDEPRVLKEIAKLVLGDDPNISMRASWALMHVSMVKPEAITPLLPSLFEFLRKTGQHTGAIRNTIRIMHEVDVPENYCGELFDICMAHIKNAAMPMAVRAFSIVTIGQICETYPELKPEVELVLSELSAFPQPASITSSIKKTSKILLKLKP
ncbi:MAG: hypothetical protein ACXVPQ_06675 [Bacteroidia bacterium]